MSRIEPKKAIEIMKNLNLSMPKKINEALPANMDCGINFNPQRYLHEDFSMDELYKVWEKDDPDQLIVDCRTLEEFSESHVPQCKNIPVGTEKEWIEKLKEYKRVYFYCRSGRRAQTAFTNLSIIGLNNLICIGHSGMQDWIEAGYQIEK